MDTDHCIDVCNQLLRGERSAVATYSKAIAAFEDDRRVPTALREILNDHEDAVLTLTENVRSMGGQPSTDSGVWGAFAKTVQGAANMLGDTAALTSLKTGEATGKKDYEAALEDEEVLPACKTLIRSRLLPVTERHIETLEMLTA